MAKFCNKCGAPLTEGQPHYCPVKTDQQYGGQQEATQYAYEEPHGYAAGGRFAADSNAGRRSVLIGMLNRMGIGDPSSNSDGIYERDKLIAPDILPLNEGEVPVRQYHVAVLRSRSKFMRSEGRMEVTNKRLLFRATGRSLRGKIALQHEFALSDVKGLEIRQDYSLSAFNLLMAILLLFLGGSIGTAIVTWLYSENSLVFGSLLGLILSAGALFCFFSLFRKFHLKVFLSGIGMMSAIEAFTFVKFYAQWAEHPFGWKLMIPFLFVAMVLSIATVLFGLLLAGMIPNLIIDIKTVGGGAPIRIRRKSILEHSEYTGFDEVLPAAETEQAIREINAMINDIQCQGDSAVRRWQN